MKSMRLGYNIQHPFDSTPLADRFEQRKAAKEIGDCIDRLIEIQKKLVSMLNEVKK